MEKVFWQCSYFQLYILYSVPSWNETETLYHVKHLILIKLGKTIIETINWMTLSCKNMWGGEKLWIKTRRKYSENIWADLYISIQNKNLNWEYISFRANCSEPTKYLCTQSRDYFLYQKYDPAKKSHFKVPTLPNVLTRRL